MPNQFSRPGVLRWAPDASSSGAPPGALLRADNLDFEEASVVRLRKGSATLYSGLGSTVNALYTAYFQGERSRLAGVGNKVYANGVDLGPTFDGEGDIAFTSWLGHVFVARGETRLKYDGTRVTNWGIPKPSKRLTATAGEQIQEFFSTCNQSESPGFTASEGTITATYPDGADGTSNGSIELTPSAVGRATITKTFGTVTDFFNVDGYAGSATDIIDLYAWFDKPEEVESVTIMFGISPTEASDPFRDDQYSFEFKIGGSDTTAQRVETSVKSSDAVAEEITALKNASSISADPQNASDGIAEYSKGLPNVSDILAGIETTPSRQLLPVDYRVDASFNPGWTHLTVSRGALKRLGTSEDRSWETVRAVRIIYKAKTGSTGKARFDSFQIYGGGERALTGKFSFLYRLVRAVQHPDGNFEYAEKSPPSEPSPYVNFRTQRAELNIPSDALASFDPQANQTWIYMTGGYLDDWYRVAIAGTEANDTSMAIDEFAMSPDGFISAADRTRLNQFGLSIPGTQTAFSPADVSGLKLWLDAEYVTGTEGSPVSYWPGRAAYGAFTPTDISSLKAWFKADTEVYSDAGSTLAVSGDTVQQWNDQTANGYDLSQATGANRPILRSSIVNGYPVVRFDGLDDFMTGTTMSNLFAVGAKFAVAVFYPDVISTNSATPSENLAVWADDGSPGLVGHVLRSSTGLVAYNDDGAVDQAASAISAGGWYTGFFAHANNDAGASATQVGSGTSSSSWFGGLTGTTSGNTSSLAGALNVGRVRDGGGVPHYFDGDLAELMFFNAIPTQAERLKLERYLVAKYGLSGYAFDETSSTIPARAESSTLKPTYKASWRNSRPAVYFDGTELMEIGASFTDVAAVGAKTVFIVGEADALMGTPGGAGSDDNNGPFWWGVSTNNFTPILLYTGFLQTLNYDGSNDFTTARAYALDTPYIWTAMHSSGTTYNGQNDTRTASMNTGTSGNTSAVASGLRLGGMRSSGTDNKFFKGYIAEVLVFDEAVSEANRQKIESYLATKYGLTSQIPYGPTASFTDTVETTDDLMVSLAASEIGALNANERLPYGVSRPPEDIVSMDAPYAERLWALCSTGFLYFSNRRDPSTWTYSHAIKIGDKANESYWVRRTSQGVYVGTAKDIMWIYGTGSEDPDTGIPDFTKILLNVADPPINSSVCNDGNDLIYMSARGPMRLAGNESIPIRIAETTLLWKGETRHGVSGINMSGRFGFASSHGDLFITVPEGASDQSTSVAYKYTDYGDSGRWRRFTYPWTISALYREPDGKVLVGTTDGKVVQLETGTQDDSTDIAVVLWTPFEDSGYPLNRKDPFDFTLKGDTGNAALSIALHKDGSGSASVTLSCALNGIDTFLDDVDAMGTCRSVQYRMTGSFSVLKIVEWNCAYRPRPQMRVHVDSGYLRKAGEDLIWYRQARVCLSASTDVSLEFWFDDTLYATKNVTVSADKTTVYEIPLGREYKGYQPRVVVRKQDQASTTADAGFELYWLELRQRPSGNLTGLDVRKVFTDLAIPIEEKVKTDARS